MRPPSPRPAASTGSGGAGAAVRKRGRSRVRGRGRRGFIASASRNGGCGGAAMLVACPPPAPPGWYVISLRPRGEHAPAAPCRGTRLGAGLIALSPLAAAGCATTTPRAMRCARRCRRRGSWSPVRRRCAPPVRCSRCAARRGNAGSRSVRAPRRHCGAPAWTTVQAPTRMDSEGLLALPGLQDLAGSRAGLHQRARRSRRAGAVVAGARCARVARRRLRAHRGRAVAARGVAIAGAVRADRAGAVQWRSTRDPCSPPCRRPRSPRLRRSRGAGRQRAAGRAGPRTAGSPTSSSRAARARATCWRRRSAARSLPRCRVRGGCGPQASGPGLAGRDADRIR